MLWCEFTLFLCDAISRRHAPITLLSKFQASVNLSLRALLLIVAVRLRVVLVDTFVRSACSNPVCASGAATKLQCLEVSLFHRGLRNFCLFHHMPPSGTGSGPGSNEPAGAT